MQLFSTNLENLQKKLIQGFQIRINDSFLILNRTIGLYFPQGQTEKAR